MASDGWGSAPHLTSSGMNGVVWFEVVVTTLFVIARTWTRVWVKGSLEFDDYWVFVAWMCLFLMSCLYTAAIPDMYLLYAVGDGKVAPPATFLTDVSSFLKLQFAIIILFWTNIWAVKASFLAVYKGIIDKRLNPWKTRAWWACTMICALSYVGCWITQFMSCTPFSSYFVVGGCTSERDLYISNLSLFYSSAVDIACDVLIMALPLSILWNLRLDTRKRIGLAALFSAGGLIIAFAVIRLIKTAPSYGHVDARWLCVMSVTECSVAVIVSCTPVFRSFLVKRNVASHHSETTPSQINGDMGSRGMRDGKRMTKEMSTDASWELRDINDGDVRPSERMSVESDEDRITPSPRVPRPQNHGYRSYWDDKV